MSTIAASVLHLTLRLGDLHTYLQYTNLQPLCAVMKDSSLEHVACCAHMCS